MSCLSIRSSGVTSKMNEPPHAVVEIVGCLAHEYGLFVRQHVRRAIFLECLVEVRLAPMFNVVWTWL